MDKEKVLIIIDMQNDFITGSLANPEAEKIVPGIVDLINKWKDSIILTMDTHEDYNYFTSLEGEYLPVLHCVKDTEGWHINKDIEEAARKQGKIYHLGKPTFGYKYWNSFLNAKNGECAFSEIFLCGTCTDICVVSNALILKAMFPEVPIYVIKDLCAGTTPTKHLEALDVMESCQVKII